jgi:predicted amidohydrolase
MSATQRRSFGIAALQLAYGPGDNLAAIAAEVAALRRRMPWVEMVLFGELCAFGPDLALAQEPEGPAEQLFRRVARDTGLWLLPGSIYERHGGQVFNVSPIIDPTGTVIGRYRKLYPWRPYERGVAAGTESLVFDVPGAGRFGVSNCYDMWFPETIRALAVQGAEVILHPGMTTTIDRDVETAIARAHAATNQCYFIDVNVAGALGNGRSVVCGPGGEVIHQAGSGREVIAVDVDFALVQRVRTRGWHGLGQPLKSFRDRDATCAAHAPPGRTTTYLESLGPLAMPETNKGNSP